MRSDGFRRVIDGVVSIKAEGVREQEWLEARALETGRPFGVKVKCDDSIKATSSR
jgi:hypothetical protein